MYFFIFAGILKTNIVFIHNYLTKKINRMVLKRIFFCTFVCTFLLCTLIQAKVHSDFTKLWTIKGESILLFTQASFSNWSSGGINSFEENLGLNYDFNYKKENWNWDNKCINGYDLNKQKEIGWRKNNNHIIIDFLVGRKCFKNRMATFCTNFQSHFTKGYDDSLKDKPLIFSFSAPAVLNVETGFAHKLSENFKMSLSPIPSKIKIVIQDELCQIGAFDVRPGDNPEYEFGTFFTLFRKNEVLKNRKRENTLSLYSDYAEQPKNVAIDDTPSIFMKENDYISANFGTQFINDDNVRFTL